MAADMAALFGPAEAAAPEGDENPEFSAAFADFVAAFQADDMVTAEAAFKQAVQACYAAESAPAEDADLEAMLAGA
jgi:hypothetical protein